MRNALVNSMDFFKYSFFVLRIFFVSFFYLFPLTTTATILDITAEYDAENSATSVGKNTFTNTTPTSGFCSDHPNLCAADEFSIIIPGLNATKYFDALSENTLDNHVAVTIDGTSRPIMLRNSKTGKEISATFRLSLISMYHHKQPTFTGSLSSVMTGTGRNPVGGCSGRIGINQGTTSFRHGWGVPDKFLTCYRRLNITDPAYQADVLMDTISIGYILSLPNPMEILSGDYEGEISYTVGKGSHLDLHAHSYSDSSDITFKIKAKVNHYFKLHYAPNSENVNLAPKGGWAQWVNGGRVPQELSQEVPFGITSSTKFKINMECSIVQSDGCGLRNSITDEVVPMNVSLTMPGFQADTGGEITNTLLTTRSNGLVISPKTTMIIDRRSRIKFSVPQTGVREMVKSPGSTWSGAVTLIFDSEVE